MCVQTAMLSVLESFVVYVAVYSVSAGTPFFKISSRSRSPWDPFSVSEVELEAANVQPRINKVPTVSCARLLRCLCGTLRVAFQCL